MTTFFLLLVAFLVFAVILWLVRELWDACRGNYLVREIARAKADERKKLIELKAAVDAEVDRLESTR